MFLAIEQRGNMPKIQVFISNPVEEEILNIVQAKRSEGADRNEANVSNTSSMLIELGLRVYKLQNEKKEGGFSQTEFNKIMLENMMKTSLICQKVIRMSSKNSEVQGLDEFTLGNMSSQIKTGVDSVMEQFFPKGEDID